MKYLILTFFLFSCASQERTEEPVQAKPVLGSEVTDALLAKRALYWELSEAHRNEYGFVPKCDSLLFSSLSKVAGYDVDIEAAEDDGRWYRRTEKDCFDTESSTSDVSKDMYIGLLWATWYEKDTSRLERLIAYGKSEDWKVGRGPLGETFITPSLRQTIAEMLKALGGKKHGTMLRYPHFWPKQYGYQAHLQVLHILLRKKMLGAVTKEEVKRIDDYYRRNPRNALFSFAYHCFTDGDYSETAEILLDEKLFPKDRLPTPQDRCENYLWQRDLGKDWEPCKRQGIHDGVDLEFVTALILEETT